MAALAPSSKGGTDIATPSNRSRVDGVEVDAAIKDERVVNLISTQVSPVRGAGFKVLYPQLPKRGFGVDSQSALKGFLKYAAASRVTLVHLVRLSQLERFLSLESIRQGQIQYHDGDMPSSHSRSRPTPLYICLLYTSPSPRDGLLSRMPSSA